MSDETLFLFEEECPVTRNNQNRNDEQDASEDALGKLFGLESLGRCNQRHVEEDRGHDASVVLVVKPVDEDRRRQDAGEKVGDVNRAHRQQTVLIVAIYEEQRQMPHRPQHAEQQRRRHHVEFRAETVHPVAAPSKLFEGRRQQNGRQHFRESAREAELIGGSPDQNRQPGRKEQRKRHQEQDDQQVPESNEPQTDKPLLEIALQVLAA